VARARAGHRDDGAHGSGRRSTHRPGLELGAADFLALRARFIALAQTAHAALSGVDALLTPACPRVAAPVEGHADPAVAAAWSRETLRFTRPGNLFGFCGVSLPIGQLAQSLPVGLQLLAAGGHDAEMLGMAGTIEAELDRPVQ
jgi:Asp-tRNA(Asn)/Glu-tRNA(Gln) amidotransferase A subunit family amidase